MKVTNGAQTSNYSSAAVHPLILPARAALPRGGGEVRSEARATIRGALSYAATGPAASTRRGSSVSRAITRRWIWEVPS